MGPESLVIRIWQAARHSISCGKLVCPEKSQTPEAGCLNLLCDSLAYIGLPGRSEDGNARFGHLCYLNSGGGETLRQPAFCSSIGGSGRKRDCWEPQPRLLQTSSTLLSCLRSALQADGFTGGVIANNSGPLQ